RYTPPSQTTSVRWKNPSTLASTTSTFDNFWELFEDPLLSELENKALSGNYSYKTALDRVAVARALAGVAKSALYPHISLNAGYDYSQEFVKFHGDKRKTLFPGLKDKLHIWEQDYSFPNIFTYELDLWGKRRSLYKSSIYQAQAEEDRARSMLLTLTCDVASQYFNIRTLDTQLDLLEQIAGLLQTALHLHRHRFASGLDNGLQLASSEKALKDLEAEIEDTLRQRTLFENALATLIGVSPYELNLPRALLSRILPSIPVDLPSTLLKKRPDIAEAERTMASRHALINMAYASYFPSLSLTGGGGISSVQLQDFLNFKGYLWQVGANLVQTIFDAGRNRSGLNAAKASFHYAEDSYKQVVLTAFQEVENALNNLSQQEKQGEKLKQSLQAAQKSAYLAEMRYQRGLVDKLSFIQHQKQALQSERSLANVLGSRYQSTLNLIKALGGSWSRSTAASSEIKRLPPLTYNKRSPS
ncbi:MAG: efflux transporter outer membrane subunit, partial [Chlamydiae bacterium]|nr:efflux transporter outer membrane subunit [Chlamydiota bacterium]